MALPVDFVVPETEPWVRYDGDGATLNFNYSFWVDDPTTDLVVLLDGVAQVYTTDYTATKSVEPQTGGVVTMVVAPSSTPEKLVIYRKLVVERLSDFSANGSLHAAVLNLDFDKIVSMLQDLKLLLSMCLQFPLSLSTTESDNILPTPSEGEYLAWGTSNNIVNRDGSDISSGNKVAVVTFTSNSLPDSDTIEWLFQMQNDEGMDIEVLQHIEFRAATSLTDYDPSDLIELNGAAVGDVMAGAGTAQITIRTTALGAGSIQMRRLSPSTTGIFPLILRSGWNCVTVVRQSNLTFAGAVFV